MESILKAFDDIANEINGILAKGGSDWAVQHQAGMSTTWELTPALDLIEAELSQVDKAEMSESEYEHLLEYHIANVFRLDLNKISYKEKQNILEYVYGYIEGGSGLLSAST